MADAAPGDRPKALTKLALALGLSGGLHAMVLSSLELLPVQWGGPPQLRLAVHLEEQAAAKAAVTAQQLPDVAPPEKARRRTASTLPERYLTPREVDVPARPRGTVPLIYPEDALIWKLHGVVRLRVFISEHGVVDGAEVILAKPAGEFEEAALDAIRRMAYEPAVKNGRPVKSQKLIEVTFDPHEQRPRS